MSLRTWLEKNLMAIDELGNTLIGGEPGETLSEHASSARRDGRRWGCWVCNFFLDIIKKNHCAEALANAVPRGQQIITDAEAPAQKL